MTDEQVGKLWHYFADAPEVLFDSTREQHLGETINDLLCKIVEGRREYLLMCCPHAIHHDCDHLEDARRELGIVE